MRLVANGIQKGWPDKQRQLPDKIKQYWTFREELSYADELIFKNSRLVVPHALRLKCSGKSMSHMWVSVRSEPVMYCTGRVSPNRREVVTQCAAHTRTIILIRATYATSSA